MTSDGKWVLGKQEKIWGPKGNAYADDIIQWKYKEVISMADWMNPAKLLTMGIKDGENVSADTLIYVFEPQRSITNKKVETVTDNLTYKITKPPFKDLPLQEGFSAVKLHKYITEEVVVPDKLLQRYLQDGFTTHYGIIPYAKDKQDDEMHDQTRMVGNRHDARQLCSGSQSYIQLHKSATVSPTIIPQMDIRVDLKATGKLRLQIQGTQISPTDSTLLYIWVYPIEDRDYTKNISAIQKKIKTLTETTAETTLDATGQGRVIEAINIQLRSLHTQFATIKAESFKPQLDEFKSKIDEEIAQMNITIRRSTAAIQAQITGEIGQGGTQIHGNIKEISYYVNGQMADTPYTGVPETGLVPGNHGRRRKRKRNHVHSFVVQNNTEKGWNDAPQDGSESESDLHDSTPRRRDEHIPRTPSAPKGKGRKQLYFAS